MYKPQKNQPFYYTLMFMHYFHYYPSAKQTKNMALYRAISVVIRVLSSFLCVECGVHLFMSLKDKVPVDITEDIGALAGLANCMLVCILFEIKRGTWSQFFGDVVNSDERFGTPPEMPMVLQKAKRYTFLYSAFCCSGSIVYAVFSAILDEDKCKRMNAEKGIHEICGTITSVWWPYNEVGTRTRWFLVVYQFFCIVSYIPPAAIFTFVTWECAQVIAAKIHHLKDLFIEVFSIGDPDLRKRRLEFCIQYHQELISISRRFSEINKKTFGHYSFVMAIILSSIGVQIFHGYSIGAVIHLTGYSVGTYLICEAGQVIQDETYNIQDAVYASDWYTDLKLGKDVLLILQRCQRPIYLETTPLGCFNYSVLIIIIKTAYSYMTLISNATS